MNSKFTQRLGAAVGLAVGVLSLGAAGCSSSNSSTPGDGGAGDGSIADAAMGPSDGGCQSGDTKTCTTFTTPTGTTLTLGPYGAEMDPNVGTGFENALQTGDGPDAGTAFCSTFTKLFNQSPALTKELLGTNEDGIDLNFAIYTVYRPATWPTTPVPVITWGNGTCAQPEGYGALLRYVASFGYFVVAANSREVGTGSPMLHALDYAAAANANPTSPYYQKLDMTKVGAMGHSQGGMATVSAASDSRVKDVIIFNAADSCSKPFFAISGDMDITGFTPSAMASAVNSAPAPGAWLYFHMVPVTGNLNGHLTLMLQPDRVTQPTVDWWKMVFSSDATATSEFVGSSCGLCGDTADHEFGENGLPPGSASPDAGATDAATPDAGATDAGSSDAAAADASSDQ